MGVTARKVHAIILRFGYLYLNYLGMSHCTDYDAMFASRFGAEDAEFQRYMQRAADTPPVVEDWRTRGRRDNR